jgi:hypothetical protein
MSLTAGFGIILMLTALAIGVMQGSTADSNLIGLMFAGGVAFFLIGAAGWFGLTQPQKHFDDINVPMDTGHHGHDHGEPHDMAIVASGEQSAGHH